MLLPDNSVFLVTGAGRGIGASVARRLAGQGAAVAVCDLDEKAAQSIADLIIREGGRSIATGLDTQDAGALDSFVGRIERELGPVTGAVPAAGITRSAPAAEMTDAAWDAVIGVNLTGVFNTCRAVGQAMIAGSQGGAIVNLASITAKGGQPGRVNYAASKWGVVGLTKSLAVEWGRFGIRVNAVAPNGVNTPMLLGGVPEEFREGVMLDRTPLGRFAEPEEVTDSILYLLSRQASYITGAVLEVDGGLTAGYLTHQRGAHFATHQKERQTSDPEQ